MEWIIVELSRHVGRANSSRVPRRECAGSSSESQAVVGDVLEKQMGIVGVDGFFVEPVRSKVR